MSPELGPDRNPGRPELDAVCGEVTDSAEGALAFAVSDVKSGELLAFHSGRYSRTSLETLARGIMEILLSKDIQRLKENFQGDDAVKEESLSEVRLAGEEECVYGKLSASKGILFLLVTESRVGPGWGWKEIRSAERRLEPLI